MVSIEQIAGKLASVRGIAHNHYTLTVDNLNLALLVHSINGQESLNQPWHYEIHFTCANKQIEISSILSQSASLTFEASHLAEQLTKISSLEKPTQPRTLYGVITEFSLLSVSKDEARYCVVLQPRLALFANDHYSAIYQNQSVVSVVEEILRRHSFTGVDYRLDLKDSYPAREFITQWQESDLEFIQRLLSDVGIWFRFESHAEHHCDVLVLSDYEQGFEDAGQIAVKATSGMVDGRQNSVWDVQFTSTTQPKDVITQDYNYRTADADQYSQVNTDAKDDTTVGTDYRYGEHYKNKGDDSEVESGQWYASIRHQAHLSQKLIIQGECNDYNLMPGQRMIIEGSAIDDIDEGIIILSTKSYADRSESYRCHFTAIPYDVLKPYRPQPLRWPQVTGTLPARVTSPDNDTYGYIDTMGRYRVKFDFDLKTWKNGEESLWVRLAKPYAGDTYGFHFPLIDGTGVAIGFTEGNPDRPYIAHALHDSTHPDHVATVNKHRNVIRTPANNKLRMDDKRGQEHIKLATEYGKTQLNIGHLVNQNKEQRGEGFELRTDEWGAIAANKGLYLTAQTEPKAQGKQLDMQGAITQLENALSIAKALHNAAQTAQAHPSDIDNQQQLQAALTQLKQAGILAYAPEGIALTSDNNIQLSSASSITTTSENHTDISALQNITIAAEESISLFAHKTGMKLFANQGKVEVQAQNDAMEIAAKQDIRVDSVDGSLLISASKDITLVCGGSYIKISGSGIELGTSGNVSVKSAALEKMGPSQLNLSPTLLPVPFVDSSGQLKLFYHDSDLNPIPRASYRVEFEDGSVREGVLDDNGEALLEDTPLGQANVYFGYSTDDAILPTIKEYEADDYSKTSVTEQLNEHIKMTSDELKAYIDSQLAYTEEYLEIGKQKQGKE